MSNLLICNGIPTYQDSPVSTIILKNEYSKLLENIQNKNIDKNYIVLGKKEKDIKINLEEELKNYPNLNLEIVSTNDDFRFVYNNESAILKTINNENPIPKSKDKSGILYSVEELLNSQEKRVFVHGKVSKSKSYEFPNKTTARKILEQCKVVGEFKAMYFAHPMGLFVNESNLDSEIEITTDRIEIFNETDCILAKLKNIASQYENETCGRCVFGFEGVTQINMILGDIINKKGKIDDLDKLKNLSIQMKTQTVCEIDTVLADSLLSALNIFNEEISNHITKKICSAMECNKFVTFHILVSKCTGCGECLDSCKEEAIIGKSKFVHVIEGDDCTQCGECLNSCEEGAIIKAGITKPKCPTKPIPCKK